MGSLFRIFNNRDALQHLQFIFHGLKKYDCIKKKIKFFFPERNKPSYLKMELNEN